MNNPKKLVPEGRLQRKALDPEFYISKFRQVLMRHGLTMSTILFMCILTPYIPTALIHSISDLFVNSNKYFLFSLSAAIMMFLFLWFTRKELNFRQLIWIIYLLLISIIEEISFRLSIPIIGVNFMGDNFFWLAVFISNFCFAAIHYFTLRWKLSACVLAFLGGMGFSRLFQITEDLTLVIILHWLLTFFNTPTAPKNNHLIQKN